MDLVSCLLQLDLCLFTFEVDAVDLSFFLVEASFHLIELRLILVLKFGLSVAVLVNVAV